MLESVNLGSTFVLSDRQKMVVQFPLTSLSNDKRLFFHTVVTRAVFDEWLLDFLTLSIALVTRWLWLFNLQVDWLLSHASRLSVSFVC